MNTPTKPGIYYGVPFSEYQQWPFVNGSLLATLRDRTPCHAEYERTHPKEPTPALEFGTQFHIALLEPAEYARQYRALPADAPRRPSDRQRNAANPSAATIAAIEWWDAWQAADYREITAENAEKIEAMRAAVLATQAKQYITGGRAEISLVWDDPVTGLRCKGRVDYGQEQPWQDNITDMKTCEDAGAEKFRKSVFFYGYHFKAAWYVDAWKIITGSEPLFYWLAVEKQPPFCCKTWQADDKALEAGRMAYRRLLDRWAECVKRGEYPAYGDNVELLGLERWMLEREGVGAYNLTPQPIEDESLGGVEGFVAAYGLEVDDV